MYQGPLDLLHKLMMLLSPEEIRALTTDSQGEQRISLTEMILKDQADTENGGEAKILPFKTKEEMSKTTDVTDEVAVESATSPIVNAEAEQGAEKVLEGPVEAAHPEEEASHDESSGLSATLLILEVKEKLKHTQEKLKEKEVLNLYRKSSAIDINQEKLNRNDLKKSSNLGVLVNKRQA